MKRALVFLVSALIGVAAYAAPSVFTARGKGTNDNDILIETVAGSTSNYDVCMIHTTAGAADVVLMLPGGSSYSTAVAMLDPRTGTDTTQVALTAAGSVYAFYGKYSRIKVLQNGATPATVVLACWDRSGS